MLSSTTKKTLSSCMETRGRERNQLMNESVDDGCDGILYPSMLLFRAGHNFSNPKPDSELPEPDIHDHYLG